MQLGYAVRWPLSEVVAVSVLGRSPLCICERVSCVWLCFAVSNGMLQQSVADAVLLGYANEKFEIMENHTVIPAHTRWSTEHCCLFAFVALVNLF